MNNSARPRGARPRPLEALESRRLLSAAIMNGGAADHFATFAPAATGSFSGYSPAQVKHAYGFDQISFAGHAGDGTGQTIAIIDAFRHPKIESDLQVFDAKFGLPAPATFTVVGQTGGSVASVAMDSGWASETALDVEWAHAIAPGASILLVEAKSDDFRDLMSAVDYARKQSGVTVVSCSWGGGEFAGQTADDKLFTTPAGHAGVTFVASSGDDGGLYGAEWPATSPNVVSVGGTVLTTTDAAGTYGSEIAWNYSTGGSSTVEKTPAFQVKAQSGLRRTAPDVAYNASVVHGFAAYCSIPDQGDVGWANVGGTSAGAPQWAGLIAIADQGRALQGKASLDGPSTTLPSLYSVYATPAYAANFTDITTGHVVPRSSAAVGYDAATGLGSPKAAAVVNTLMTATPALAATTTTTTGRRGRHARAHNVHGVPGGGETGDGQLSSPQPNTDGGGVTTPTSPAPAVLVTYPIRLTDQQAPANPNAAVYAASADRVAANVDGPATGTRGTAAVSQLRWFLEGNAAAELPTGVVFAMTPVATDGGPADTVDAVPMTPVDRPAVVPVVASVHSGGAFNFTHPEAGATFADAMASFVHDSTALGGVVLPASGRSRAWAITGAVLTVDAIMVGSWYAQYRRAKQQQAAAVRVRRASPFVLRRAEWEE